MMNNNLPNRTVPVCSQAPIGQSCCCCKRCGIGGCDLRLECGCCFHTRCCSASKQQRLIYCPICFQQVGTITLMPMTFDEIDQAAAEAARTGISDKRGKKRKNATIARLQPIAASIEESNCDLRTGRWTTEETAFCDKLIELFEAGKLPISDGIKLNDFLSNMLKSKPSRLTKKMKNARLSARQYKCHTGYIDAEDLTREFSALEAEFFASIRCSMERSEIRFHMQREWRELYSNYCVSVGLKLDAAAWLNSVEEMDRRLSVQKDAARVARRKVMMGFALSHDTMHTEQGVFIDSANLTESKSPVMPQVSFVSSTGGSESDLSSPTVKVSKSKKRETSTYTTSPFLAKVLLYIKRNNVPFEYVDIWVPSFVPGLQGATLDQKCRLCFGGFATLDVHVSPGEIESSQLSSDQQFDLFSFGEYSEKFSFDVGCGLPGRVYSSGVASWEQGIQNAPNGLFERRGGAVQWGINTVLGIPIPSPNVGRVVILFYSIHDRARDVELVARLSEDLSKFLPSPKWKLVVDIGGQRPAAIQGNAGESADPRIVQLQSLVTKYMPEDKSSPLSAYLPGFTSLHLLFLKQEKTPREEELMELALRSYDSHKIGGRSERDLAWMTARDFMYMTKQYIPHHEPAQANISPNPVAIPDPAANLGCGFLMPEPTSINNIKNGGITAAAGKSEGGISDNSFLNGTYYDPPKADDLMRTQPASGAQPFNFDLGDQQASSGDLGLLSGIGPVGLSASQFASFLQNFQHG